VISSFNWVSLERARELVPGVATGFLTAPGVDMSVNLAYVREHGHRICLPHLEALSRDGGSRAVADARADGRDVMVWTVEEPGQAVDLARLGVTGLIADDPEAVLAELAAQGFGSS
jgi:glycerophosphoryl diester phosphodiesterase